MVGLAISYALSVTNLLSGVVTSFTETEKEMVSVERAMQYIKGAPVENNTGDQEVKNSSNHFPLIVLSLHIFICYSFVIMFVFHSLHKNGHQKEQ